MYLNLRQFSGNYSFCYTQFVSQIIIQGMGFVALLFIILSFQSDKRSRILIYMIIGVLLYVLHYILLHAWIGALMNFIEAGVVYVSHQKETKKWAMQKFWPYVFIVLFIIAGVITSKTFIDMLPVVAQALGTIAVWQKSNKAIRLIMLSPRPLWFAYNFFVGSYAGMASEIFIFLSVMTGIVRFDILRKSAKKISR